MTNNLIADSSASPLQAIARAQGWVLDVDGCLVRTKSPGGSGGTPMPGAPELLRWLRENNRSVIVCTNASQRPIRQYASHLRAIGLSIADHELITAATAAAAYIASLHPGALVLPIGDEGLDDALREQNVELAFPGGPLADVVIVGSADVYATNRLNAACVAIADHNAVFYVTVDTKWFYGGMGRSVSASTAIAYAIAAITGRQPVVCGKPSPAIARVLLDRLGGRADDIVVVGDTASIEIQLAHVMGAFGVLVLSGATSLSDIAGLPPEHRPHLQVNDVSALLQIMRSIYPQRGDRT